MSACRGCVLEDECTQCVSDLRLRSFVISPIVLDSFFHVKYFQVIVFYCIVMHILKRLYKENVLNF